MCCLPPLGHGIHDHRQLIKFQAMSTIQTNPSWILSAADLLPHLLVSELLNFQYRLAPGSSCALNSTNAILTSLTQTDHVLVPMRICSIHIMAIAVCCPISGHADIDTAAYCSLNTSWHNSIIVIFPGAHAALIERLIAMHACKQC